MLKYFLKTQTLPVSNGSKRINDYEWNEIRTLCNHQSSELIVLWKAFECVKESKIYCSMNNSSYYHNIKSFKNPYDSVLLSCLWNAVPCILKLSWDIYKDMDVCLIKSKFTLRFFFWLACTNANSNIHS